LPDHVRPTAPKLCNEVAQLAARSSAKLIKRAPRAEFTVSREVFHIEIGELLAREHRFKDVFGIPTGEQGRRIFVQVRTDVPIQCIATERAQELPELFCLLALTPGENVPKKTRGVRVEGDVEVNPEGCPPPTPRLRDDPIVEDG
jgi:hypothetical protein